MKRIRRYVLNKALIHLFHITDMENVSLGSGDEVRVQAQSILQNPLWKNLVRRLRYEAYNKICNTSTRDADIVFPKALMYTISSMDKKLRELAQKPTIQVSNKKKW